MVTANQSALLTAGALAVAGSVYLLLASRGKKARVKYIIGKVNYQADSVPASLRSSGKVCAAGACDARAAALCSGGLVRAGACSDRRPARHLVSRPRRWREGGREREREREREIIMNNVNNIVPCPPGSYFHEQWRSLQRWAADKRASA